MTKQEFNKLTLQEKAELCWSEGEFVNWVHYYAQKVLLYVVEGHFIEIYYSPQINDVSVIEILENTR